MKLVTQMPLPSPSFFPLYYKAGVENNCGACLRSCTLRLSLEICVREGVLRKIDLCCFISLKGDCSSLKKWPAEGCWNDTACCALAPSLSEALKAGRPDDPPLLMSLCHGRSLSLSHPTCHTNTHSETTCINKSTHVQSGLCLPPAHFNTRSPCSVSAFSWWDVRITLPALRGRDVTDFTPTRVMTHSSLTTL